MEDSEIEALVRRLKAGDPKLTKLQLNSCFLGPSQVARILNEMKSNCNIVELQLQQNYIGADGMTSLINVIEEQRQLRAIDLRFNLLPAAEIRRLWRKLQQNFTLEDVRIDEELGDEDEVPFQVVVGADASETDGLTWSTFAKPQLVEFRTKLHELLISNRRIGECIRGKGPELKLRNRSLEKVPEMILLPHLKILDLRNNQLGSLPLAGMDRMVSLEELYLDYNRIRSLPRSLCNLGKLRVLSVRKNQLTDLPKCISCMSSLKELRLSGNELYEIPIVIAAITTLQRVELEENPFVKRYPKFPTVSDQILPFLKEELKSRGLPKNPRMRVVVVGADMVGKSSLIRALQPTEGVEKKRKKRNASATVSGASAASFFSSKLGDMMSPSVSGVIGSGSGVMVSGNVGDSMKTPMPMLTRERSDTTTNAFTSAMNILGNSALSSNLSVLSGPTTSSSDDGTNSPTPFFHFGSSQYGAAPGTGIFINRPHIEISPIVLPSSVLSSASSHGAADDLILNVWELSGANTALSAHSLFATDLQTCYLVVFNLTQPAEHQSYIEHWLHTIHLRAKDSPVILVGTHADDKRCTKDYIEATFRAILMRTNAEALFPNLKFLYDLDASNPAALKGLRRSLFELALPEIVTTGPSSQDGAKEPKQLGVKVAESWLALEERLYAAREQAGSNQAKKEDFFEKMIRRATGSKPPLTDSIPSMASLQGASQAVLSTLREAVSMDVSEKDHPTLLGYLNAVGAVVTMKDAGHVVLDPQWLIEAATALFTYKAGPNSATSKGCKNGFIQRTDLETVWPSPKFPSSEHAWLLQTFEKNDMIISVDKKTIFVPYALPQQPPSTISQIWLGDEDITEQRRYYVFNMCPTATFFKLLQKLLTLAEWETQLHWRYGLVMEDLRKTAQVFIFLDLETKTVKLIVRGRQQVLKMVAIAEAIELIMGEASSIKKQKYTAMVPCRHCIQEARELDASLFALTSLEAAVNKNPANALVNCSAGKKPRTVRVDWLAPDVALSTFSGDRIEFKDIELGDVIGEGGYATVYKGKWRGQVVAVKQVKLASVNIVNNETDNVFAEFRREVQLMSGLQNENLVVLRAICMEPFCMVIEFMELGSLYDYTHAPVWQTIDWSTRINLALDIARGMAFLHGMMPPIVHRDLKSPNILLTTNSADGRLRAKVADFGLSRSLDFSRELDGGSLEGNNPVWLAPEILLQQNYNEKVDVYAFGLILFEMISGQDYFGECAFMSDIENLVVAGKRPKIDLLESDPFGVQEAYDELVQACWDPSPTERPTFTEAVSALTSLLRKCGVDVAEDKPTAVEEDLAQPAIDGSSSVTASSGTSNMNESSDSGENGPKRDILKEYKSQLRETDEKSFGGGSGPEDDDQTTSSNSSTSKSHANGVIDTTSSPEAAKRSNKQGTLRKEKTVKEPAGTKRNKHASSPRETTASIDSSSPPTEPRSGTSGLSSKPSGTTKHATERKTKHRTKVSTGSSNDTQSNSSGEDSDQEVPAKSSSAKPKATVPALGSTSGLGVAPAVRAQLSPRSGSEPDPTPSHSNDKSPVTSKAKPKATK